MPTPDANKWAPGVPESQYGFQGNSDAYGLGIRAGYYAQAFTVWGANFFVPHEAPFLHSVNILFIFAMLVGIICLVTTESGNVWAVEPFMLLNITYSVAWVGTCNPYVRESLPWEWTIKTGFVRQLSFLSLDAFALWYWFIGLPTMKPTVGDNGTQVYFYATGDLFGGIRIANQVITVLDIVLRCGELLCRGAVAYQDRRLDKMATAQSLKSQAWRWKPDVAKQRDMSSKPLDEKSADSEKESISILSRVETASNPPSLSQQTTHFWSTPAVISRSTSRPAKRIHEPSIPYHPSREALRRAEELLDAVLVTGTVKWYWNMLNFFYLPLTVIHTLAHATIRSRLHLRLLLMIFHYISIQSDPQVHHFVESLRILLRRADLRAGEVDWRALAVIMRFRIALDPPLPAPKRKRIGQMFHTLGIAMVLAIGTELTIQWNYIRGVQKIGTVGQLIPLSLGVGSLLKVVWGAFVGDEDWCGRTCSLEKKLLQWREPALLWEDAKHTPTVTVQPKDALEDKAKEPESDEAV